MDSSQVVLLLAAVAVGAGLAFIIVRNGSKAAIDGRSRQTALSCRLDLPP